MSELIDTKIINTLLNNRELIGKFFEKKREYKHTIFYSRPYKTSNIVYCMKDKYTKTTHFFTPFNFFNTFVTKELRTSSKNSYNDKIANIIYDYIIKYKKLNKILE